MWAPKGSTAHAGRFGRQRRPAGACRALRARPDHLHVCRRFAACSQHHCQILGPTAETAAASSARKLSRSVPSIVGPAPGLHFVLLTCSCPERRQREEERRKQGPRCRGHPRLAFNRPFVKQLAVGRKQSNKPIKHARSSGLPTAYVGIRRGDAQRSTWPLLHSPPILAPHHQSFLLTEAVITCGRRCPKGHSKASSPHRQLAKALHRGGQVGGARLGAPYLEA